jgi:hypothetical protein
VAVAAAVAVVALFVALLNSARPGGPSVGGHATSTTAIRPTPTGPSTRNSQWQPVAGLTTLASAPVIAPSDPRVVYLAGSDETLRRSDDDGATWHNLPLPAQFPQGATVQWVDLFVSPIHAQTVFVTAAVSLNNQPDCSAVKSTTYIGALARFSGYVPCNLQYVSTNGGQTWHHAQIDIQNNANGLSDVVGNLNGDAINIYPYSAPPQAGVDGALYDFAWFGPQIGSPSYRVVRSTDGGLTWHAIDQDLQNAGLNACDYAVSDRDGTLFAVVASSGCSYDAPPPIQLWRSTDHGTHWTQAALPSQGLEEGMTVTNGTLYLALAVPSGQAHVGGGTLGPTNIYASTNAAHSWTTAPAKGVPTGALAFNPQLVGVGGAALISFDAPGSQSSSLPLFTWLAGADSWHSGDVPPLMALNFARILVTRDGQSGVLTYWAVVGAAGPNSNQAYYSVQRVRL